MFYLTRPSEREIGTFLSSLPGSAFSYSAIGSSLTQPPEGFNVDHNRIRIGTGEQDFQRAKEALGEWKMFDFPWVEVCWPSAQIDAGTNVAVLIRHFGFYSLNGARIVYVINDPDRFGFAYGTLADHGESGEERFSIQFDRGSGAVVYDILAFSRPSHPLAKLGFPLTRHLQKRFARDSMAAMSRTLGA